MGKPAARVTDMHVCPMVTPGTPPIPHVGGPIQPPCAPKVLIGGLPAARVTDRAICIGPPDVIVEGSTGVFIQGLPAARLGDHCAHGGVIVTGMASVLIGDTSTGGGDDEGSGGILQSIGNWVSDKLDAAGFELSEPAKWKFDVEGKFEFGHHFLERNERKYGYEARNSKESENLKKKFTFKSGVGAKKKGEWRKLGNDDDNIRLGTFELGVHLGVEGNLDGDMFIGTFGKAGVAGVKVSGQAGKKEDFVRGKFEAEVLSAEAEAAFGYSKTKEFTGAEAKLGGEINIIKGQLEGSFNVSPKTLYDNTTGKMVRWWTNDEKRGHLSDVWDHGVKLGGSIEGGVGAAAKAEARAGLTDGDPGISFGAKLGAGPMAGFKTFIGVY